MESKEREILTAVRKVLTSIIRDITPDPGKPMPITADTMKGMQDCLKLISVRERELADASGEAMEKPYYVDQQPTTKVVSINSIGGLSDEDNKEE